jgi:predicted phage-related endonuclease
MTKRPASLAAAIMGLSPYQTRDDVLKLYSTGIVPEIDANLQRIFDNGHRIEPMARSIIENIIGEDLSPVVYSDGLLSCSTDGITFDESIGFECKQWNKKLEQDVIAGIVPDSHMPQVQQCLMITGAQEWYFTVSDGTNENTVYTIVKPDKNWFDRITAAWAQFEVDLANYAPVIHSEKPVHDAVKELPALVIHAYGEITTNNMQDFGNALAARLKEVRAIVLIDDKDFANANKAAKDFRGQIVKLEAVKKSMLEQTTSIGEAARLIDSWCEDLRLTALQLEKDVKREDLAKKESIISAARNAWNDYINALSETIKPIRPALTTPNFADAIARKRDYNSMQNGVDTMLANAKIEADAAVKNIREKLDYMDANAKDYRFLFSDMDKMIGFEKDHFEMTVRVRIESHKKAEVDKLEAQRIKIQQEEEEKAKRKAEAEQAKKLEAALKEQHAEAMARIAEENRIERERTEAERQEKIRLEQHQRDIDIELHESKIEIKKEEIAEPVTISRTEYLKLKGDSAQLWKIIELWHQAKRMSECAERADSSSVRNKELVEARNVRQQAIDIIENR